MSILKTAPAVFVVEDEYQIFVPVTESSVMWIKVGDECYYDHSNGILRSSPTVHKITVPLKALDFARSYTVCYRKMIERKPYFSVASDVFEETFNFRPLPQGSFNLYQVADSHGMVNGAIAAAKVFENKYGKTDLLVLNGDVIDHSGDVKNFTAIYEIVSGITGGEIPVIFSRGNHDTRGVYAEVFENYTPTRGGISYFSVKLPGLYALVLDCGEDKPDGNAEYGHTNCHEYFRREETKYLEHLAESGEFRLQEGKRKLVLAHVPFSERFRHPFNIEEDTYTYWCRILKDEMKPDLMVAGHIHKSYISRPGCELDAFGQPCTVIVGSSPNTKARTYAGCGIVFDGDKTTVVFSDENKITYEETL